MHDPLPSSIVACVDVRRANPEELEACLALRREVFVQEQGVPEGEDVDGLDLAATHVVAWDGPLLVGTARLRHMEGAVGKIERVAVRAGRRGCGIGAALMSLLEALAGGAGDRVARLSAQESALNFYQRLGYKEFGERFLDAGIWHRRMEKTLCSPPLP